MINKTLTAALLCGAVAIAVPAMAQVGAAGSVIGGASGAASSAGANINGAADSTLNGATSIKPQAGTPPINPSADASVSGAIKTPPTSPVTNSVDSAADKADGAINKASDQAADTLKNLPNENASVNGQSNASAAVAGENIQSGIGVSANADSSTLTKSASNSAVTLGQKTQAKTASAERKATQELNQAAASGSLSGMSNASVSPSSLSGSASGSSSANVPPVILP